jgi:hypothetical protein
VTRRIVVLVDELVLDGVPVAERHAVTEAFRHELGESLARDVGLATRGERRSLSGTFELGSGAVMGRSAAQSLHRELGR